MRYVGATSSSFKGQSRASDGSVKQRVFARCSAFVPLIAILVWSALAGPSIATAQLASAREYRIKAEFLYNFAKFIDWPADTFSDPKQPICICVYGRDPFGHALEEALLGKSIGERPVILGHAMQFDDLAGCQIIFVTGSDHVPISDLAGRLRGRAVLLVGETDGFAAAGGAIQFVIEDGRVRIVINPAAADRAGVKIGARLLSVSKIVRDSNRPVAGNAVR
jgi:YfiR/HmsC-like